MQSDSNASSTKGSSTSSSNSSDETRLEERDAPKATKRKRSFEKTITKKIEALADVLQSSAKKQKVHEFKYVSNREQYHFNEQVMEDLGRITKGASKKVSKRLSETVKKIRTRNKLIKMADKSKAGWRIVEEYLTDDIASDAEDNKKIKQAEKAALKKMKEEKEKKKEATRNSRVRNPAADEGKFRNAPHKSKNKGSDVCFRCGKKGHWGSECRTYRREEQYEREERNRRY